MKALILVGGYGTRLRPLTFSVPKPLVPFANKAIVVHQIEALVKVGVTTIIVAVNYKPQVMLDFFKQCEEKYGISIICSQEEVPLGTAGPVALAREHLTADDEPFFMFNSDVICTFPLEDMLKYHKKHKAEGTIMVTQVKDPSKYGVVVAKKSGEIERFVEKPEEFVSDRINAGIYLFNPSIVNRIELKPTSIERVIFPAMASEHQLYAMLLPGYWMDIGQPKDYLTGSVLHLNWLSENKEDTTGSINGVEIVHPVLIHDTAVLEPGCKIGPHVVIGEKVRVGAGARIRRSSVFAGASIGAHSWINSTIVGWESRIGSWSRVNECVIGKDVSVANEINVNGVTVCPHKSVSASEDSPKIIL